MAMPTTMMPSAAETVTETSGSAPFIHGGNPTAGLHYESERERERGREIEREGERESERETAEKENNIISR